jgi:hypothetical protein
MSREIIEAETSQCTNCKHCNETEFICPAYPYGIPDEVLRNEILHDEVLDNQFGDIVFEEA